MPHLDHLGLAVDAPEPVIQLFDTLLGAHCYKHETVPSQYVRTHFIAADSAKLELLESLDDPSPVARFLERRGEGLHHLAFEVDDIEATMARCREQGFSPLSDTPQPGADDKQIFFLHPKDTHGVLIEFCQSMPTSLAPTYVPRKDGRLAVYEAGAAEAPPVLLLHGAAGCTQLETASLFRRLAPHYRVVAVDFSGHGASTTALPLSFDTFAGDALVALDHFGVDRADVFGFSMGAAVALHLARSHPARVQRLALHGACITWDDAQVAALQRRLDWDALRAQSPDRAAELDRLHADAPTLFRRMRAFVASLPDRSADLEQRVASLKQPTLVSAVDADDLFPRAVPLALHDRLPNSRLALIPGSQHALQATDLDVLIPLLRRHFSPASPSFFR